MCGVYILFYSDVRLWSKIWDWDAVHLCYNICDEGRILSVVESGGKSFGSTWIWDIRKENGEKINMKNTFLMSK